MQRDAVGQTDAAHGDLVLGWLGWVLMLLVDGSRQNGIHDCVPHNWLGEVAEVSPLRRAKVSPRWVADRTGANPSGS